jgi:hypothetical protein
MTAEQQILNDLIDREKTFKTATEFANLLGVSLSEWTRTKYGERRLGPMVAVGAAQAFPELEPLTGIFLRHEFTTRKKAMRTSKQSAKSA